MTDTTRAAANRLAMLKALTVQLKKADTDARGDALALLDEGDRKKAVLPDGTVIGSVTYTEGSNEMKVTDLPAYVESVRVAYPSEVETVPAIRRGSLPAALKILAEHAPELLEESDRVRESFETVLLSRLIPSDIDEVMIDKATGVLIEGVEVARKDGHIMVSQSAQQLAALIEAYRAGDVDLFQAVVPQIEAP